MKNPSVIVYSTSWCQPCKFAKRLLDSKGLEYSEIDIEEKDGAEKIFLKLLAVGPYRRLLLMKNQSAATMIY